LQPEQNCNGVKTKEVIAALERVAPLPLQEDFDNAGLQVGLTEAEVSGALLCLDVTEAVVDEALRRGCNLIVSHHPLIFHKLRRVSDETYVQRAVIKALKNDVAIVSMHTNLDNAPGGVNFMMADRLGLQNCAFFGPQKEAEGVVGGSGVVGEWAEGISSAAFVALLKERFEARCVMTNALLDRKIRRVALCGGAGSFLLSEAIRAKADAFVTGEMHYHEYFDHEQEIQIAVIGHYESEHFTAETLRCIIEKTCPGVRCCVAETNTNPILYH